jgi:Xaa-Pro aminopeptidase
LNLGVPGAENEVSADAYSRRKAALWALPQLTNLDAFLVTDSVHHRYLCGFSGSNANLLVTHDSSHFFTDGRYGQQSSEEVKDAEIEIVEGPLRPALKGFLSAAQKVGIESGRLTVAEADALTISFPQVEWNPVEGAIEQLRLSKDGEEIACIRKASEIAVSVMVEVSAKLEPGLTELAVAGAVEESLRRHGSEGSAFEPIVASGIRGAMPHGRASGKEICEGECVTIDFGAIWNGYHSDITRSCAIGEPDPVFLQWQEILDEAIEAALALVKPGIACKDLDAASRGVIDEAGLGDYFVHNLGHGIGLEVHESPHVTKTSEYVLIEGMVFTIEPGIYVPGKGGMRIEENVAVGAHGAQLLTVASRSLQPQETG